MHNIAFAMAVGAVTGIAAVAPTDFIHEGTPVAIGIAAGVCVFTGALTLKVGMWLQKISDRLTIIEDRCRNACHLTDLQKKNVELLQNHEELLKQIVEKGHRK